MTSEYESKIYPQDYKAELDTIRAQFKVLAQEKRGLAGNREFMDTGYLNASYPEPTHCTPFMINSIQAERVEAGSGIGSQTVLLHCHGGGYAVGSTLSHRPLAAQLSFATGRSVINFNYRLAPENRFPCALDDAIEVYQWLLAHYPPSAITISGDSAGGSLAFALLLAISDRGLPQPAAVIGLSPWLDLACEGNTFDINKPFDPAGNRGGFLMMAHSYAGKDQLKHPLVSPLYADTLANLCPMLLQAGTAETLLDDSRRFTEKALKDGVGITLQEWPDMIHVWHSFYGRIPQALDALHAIGPWLNAHRLISERLVGYAVKK